MTEDSKGIVEEVTETTVEAKVEVSNNSKEETTVEKKELAKEKTETNDKLEEEYSQLKKEIEQLRKENSELKSSTNKTLDEVKIEKPIKSDVDELIKKYDSKFEELEKTIISLRQANEFTTTSNSNQQNKLTGFEEMSPEDVNRLKSRI